LTIENTIYLNQIGRVGFLRAKEIQLFVSCKSGLSELLRIN